MVLSHHCQLAAPGGPWDSSSQGEAEGRRETRFYLKWWVCAREVEDGGGGREGRDDSLSLAMTPGVQHALLTASDTTMRGEG